MTAAIYSTPDGDVTLVTEVNVNGQKVPLHVDVQALPEYSTYAYHKSGKQAYPKLKTLKVGTEFHDTTGKRYRLLTSGAMSLVISDGQRVWKINGDLRGRVI